MINITPLTIVIFQIIAACAAYAVVWLTVQAWRWFVAWCMEIT